MLLLVLADTIARQRGKYYGFGQYPEEYPIFEQCQNIDQTPVDNLAEESQCGNAIPQPDYSQVFGQQCMFIYDFVLIRLPDF